MDRGIAFALVLPVTLALAAAKAQRAQFFDERMRELVVPDAPRIRNDSVRVVDGTGASAVPGQSLLVVGGKVARLGTAAEPHREPANVVIDGHGRTVMPGLVMLHDEDVAPMGRTDGVFRDGIAYDPTRLQEGVRGKIGR